MNRLCCVLITSFAAAIVHAHPLDHGDIVTFPTRAGVTQSIFIESPSTNPPWVVVLFPGLSGTLHMDAGGATTLKSNFVIRSAHRWVDWGDAVALVDTPSDRGQGVDTLFRLTNDSFKDTRAIVATLRQRFPSSKIALVGTSAGTLSVGNALQRDPVLADAFVLTSPLTVSDRCGDTLAGLVVDGIKYRVLVVSNQHDECRASPAGAGKHLTERNHFDFVLVDSTEGDGGKCGDHSPHGFLGIDKEVLGDINNWLAGQPVTGQ
jgi:hypothetical protein